MPSMRPIYGTPPVASQRLRDVTRILRIGCVIGLAIELAGPLVETALAQRTPFSGRSVYSPAPRRNAIARTPPVGWEEAS